MATKIRWLRIRNGMWHYQFQLDGQDYSGSTGLAGTPRNENAAIELVAAMRQPLKEGQSPERRIEVRRFIDAADAFLLWAQGEYRDHPNSFRRIKTSFASAKEFFLSDLVSHIHPGRVEDYKAWRRVANQVKEITLRHDLHALSGFFRYAIQQGWTHKNPIAEVKIPSDKDAVRMHVLSSEEEETYFHLASEHQDLFDLGRLIINQGMRPEEVTSLLKSDVDLVGGGLRVRKGKSRAARRRLELTGESRSIFGRRMAGAWPWIFPQEKNPDKPIARLNSAHDRLFAKAQKNGIAIESFVLYDLRHTFATRQAELGVDAFKLAKILGHSSIRMVERYVHPTQQGQDEAMRNYGEWMEQQKAQREKRGRVQ